ncbi:hypothetical protein J3R82DRAFT_11350 [Butyriboletus roseoflavus]|nr:hypothetical protein J3R82DRAFT_11350 [Butyriboletus roseoflavus]
MIQWSTPIWNYSILDDKDDILSNPEFDGHVDYAPYQDFTHTDKTHQYEHLMSGDWMWTQVDSISQNEHTQEGAFIPIILSSNKTTVTMGTGQQDYWPVYISIRNLHNNIWQAYGSGVELLAFMAIPKGK